MFINVIVPFISFYVRRIEKQFLNRASATIQQTRNLQIHENLAYTLLKDAGIPTPPFGVAKTPEEAEKIAANLNTKDIVLKAQVLAGGRGIGHFKDTNVRGVVMCESPKEAKTVASSMIGKLLITKQTGPAGKICNSVMVTTRMFPRKEYYISVMLETTFDGPVIIVSKQGGVNIEDIAATSPEAISYTPIDIMKGLTLEQINKIVDNLGLEGESKKLTSIIICNLYELFIEKDALLLEINPFALDICEEYFALDCKCSFDDSAEFRQKELFNLQDISQIDPSELHATKFNLNYIHLDGNIGCLVNGAGLAMATMDVIKMNGGFPANFLDVGGSATKEAVTEGRSNIRKYFWRYYEMRHNRTRYYCCIQRITDKSANSCKTTVNIKKGGDMKAQVTFRSPLPLFSKMATMLSRTISLVENLTRFNGSKILGCKINLVKQVRNLNVHEHISYSLLNEAGVPTPKFGVAKTPDEAAKLAADLKSKDIVLKAQVLAGGRGKGHFKGTNISGVKMCETPEEAKKLASQMLGKLLITKQTGEAGRICNAVMVTQRMFPRKEYYLAVMMERAFGGPVIIASSQGGVNIEEVAATNPSAIMYEPIDIYKGITKDQAERIAIKLGLQNVKDYISNIIVNLYQMFLKKDALLLEVNPLAEDVNGQYFALDCKCRFDDNAEFRQKELFSLRDWTQEDTKEVEAAKYDLNYIALDGNIGCMVNGAGLAMATMDIIKLHGGEPANFLDVGGGASTSAVKEAFKIITSDSRVHALLVNIFGGIMRCDVIAEGIIAATKELSLKIPVVVRLQGTNVDEAKALIANAGLKIVPIDDLDEAARVAVKLSTIVKLAQSENLSVNFEIPSIS
ncbi:hypothetical protein HZU73_09694 [Apis mellifera caucasica]|uniref:Succinate--CoA ligase [ADP-forming] subunit beta, mitochondrial n=2 Tax=Apis TaxID=7459 RepID=A0A7M7R874_APIME|nr:uncharacterized protein LOC551958 [Apis mellifera]KAG6795242.1 hypothetical protein HZU73_09694 [Apis mellifera caucasica]KAG9428663.1 hypothetical protein HZU67_10067 [Apis mellifera carnica]|eukprot:XP_624343.2 uncharacterized protein LOC551958 [Apis mellifera]